MICAIPLGAGMTAKAMCARKPAPRVPSQNSGGMRTDILDLQRNGNSRTDSCTTTCARSRTADIRGNWRRVFGQLPCEYPPISYRLRVSYHDNPRAHPV